MKAGGLDVRLGADLIIPVTRTSIGIDSPFPGANGDKFILGIDPNISLLWGDKKSFRGGVGLTLGTMIGAVNEQVHSVDPFVKPSHLFHARLDGHLIFPEMGPSTLAFFLEAGLGVYVTTGAVAERGIPGQEERAMVETFSPIIGLQSSVLDPVIVRAGILYPLFTWSPQDRGTSSEKSSLQWVTFGNDDDTVLPMPFVGIGVDL